MRRKLLIRGRGLVEGVGEGLILVTKDPISFYGGVDPETGEVVERGHELYGETIAGKILAFPYGKGSTVGSYVLLRLARRGKAPAGIVNLSSEPIVVIGCMLGDIPLMDNPSIDLFTTKDEILGRKGRIRVRSGVGVLEAFD